MDRPIDQATNSLLARPSGIWGFGGDGKGNAVGAQVEGKEQCGGGVSRSGAARAGEEAAWLSAGDLGDEWRWGRGSMGRKKGKAEEEEWGFSDPFFYFCIYVRRYFLFWELFERFSISMSKD